MSIIGIDHMATWDSLPSHESNEQCLSFRIFTGREQNAKFIFIGSISIQRWLNLPNRVLYAFYVDATYHCNSYEINIDHAVSPNVYLHSIVASCDGVLIVMKLRLTTAAVWSMIIYEPIFAHTFNDFNTYFNGVAFVVRARKFQYMQFNGRPTTVSEKSTIVSTGGV